MNKTTNENLVKDINKSQTKIKMELIREIDKMMLDRLPDWFDDELKEIRKSGDVSDDIVELILGEYYGKSLLVNYLNKGYKLLDFYNDTQYKNRM